MLLDIYQAALAAVDPSRAVAQALEGLPERCWVIGAGKAAPAMARAVTERMAGGLLITREGQGCSDLPIPVREAGHPILDQRSLDATAELLELVDSLGPDDFVLVLLSGGASALLELPAPPLTLADLQATSDLLLRSGASIGAVNCVRSQLSQVKGGRLGRRLKGPARTLILSDIVGGEVSMVGSGPTVTATATPAQALQTLARYRLSELVPAVVLERLRSLPPEPVAVNHPYTLVGDNRRMALAAVERARELGLEPQLLTAFLEGEAREVGRFLAGLARELRFQGRRGCYVLSGETTVTVRGSGRGGRCQELALAFALACEGPGIHLMAASSDGSDGPTDAAGALVDGETCARARARGLDPCAYLDDNDAYGFFERLDEAWITGPTGTNTNDLVVLSVE